MQREHFGSRFAVIMALAGSAIGLGNIWRFPYMVGENGGAAFIVIYIAASLILSLPIFFAEFIIGRRSRSNCYGAMSTLAPGTPWKWLGLLCIITPTIIVSYYSVVGGWAADYLVRAVTLQFLRTPESEVSGIFSSFISSAWTPLAYFTVYLAVACAIVASGVKKGIETFSKYSIPLLFVLVVAIAIYSLTLPGAGEGIRYLVLPDFGKLSAKTFVNALGQSFYSLSLGMGILITYASYVSRQENLLVSGLCTALSDVIFAIIAGFAIMPAVFAAGIGPASGPGLIFETLPYIFARMGQEAPIVGAAVSVTFFVTILVAALTSTISLLEVGVAYLIEEHGLERRTACLAIFGVTFIPGALSSLSFGPLSSLEVAGYRIFDFLDIFSSNILLTVGGFLCVVFVGWKMPREDVRDEFTNGGSLKVNARLFAPMYLLIRYAAPVAVAIIFISNFL